MSSTELIGATQGYDWKAAASWQHTARLNVIGLVVACCLTLLACRDQDSPIRQHEYHDDMFHFSAQLPQGWRLGERDDAGSYVLLGPSVGGFDTNIVFDASPITGSFDHSVNKVAEIMKSAGYDDLEITNTSIRQRVPCIRIIARPAHYNDSIVQTCYILDRGATALIVMYSRSSNGEAEALDHDFEWFIQTIRLEQ